MHSSKAVLTTITGPKARQIYKQMTGREPDCTRMGSSKAVLTTITGPKARAIYDEMTRPHHFSDKELKKTIRENDKRLAKEGLTFWKLLRL